MECINISISEFVRDLIYTVGSRRRRGLLYRVSAQEFEEIEIAFI